MGLRPAKCYRSTKDRAYTRLAVTVPEKNYIGASPAMKIRQFNMGNPIKEFDTILDLVALNEVQIRDNAIESIRVAINKYLNKNLGKDNYFMKIRVYPSHILRENKIAQGAGADRVSTGMSHSFGVPIGRAIRTRLGQKILSILVDKTQTKNAQQGMLRAKSKIPTDIKVSIHDDVKSIGTKPSKVKEIEEKKEETKTKETEKTTTTGTETKTKEETKGKTSTPAKEETKTKK